MDSVINEYCKTIFDHGQTISPGELKSLFDLIVIELNKTNNSTINDYYKIMHTLKNILDLTLIDEFIVNNEIFYLIRNLLSDILNKWSKDNIILNDKDEYLFNQIVDLFSNMIKQLREKDQVLSSKFRTWFLDESFFKAIASVLEDISINSSKYFNQDRNMQSLKTLIRSIQSFQYDNDLIRNNSNVLLLINPIIKCLSSSVYIDTLKKLNTKSTSCNSFEDFILGTIPSYCAWHRGKAQLIIINQLCLNNMLTSYQEIYELFLPSINNWEYALMESIYYMTALLRYVPYYPSTREYLKDNIKIFNSILIILNTDCLLNNILITTNYNSKTNLTDSAISFIFNLTHDFQYLTLIKENLFFSKEIFLKLKHSKVDRVKLHAFMILAKILDDIPHADDILNFWY